MIDYINWDEILKKEDRLIENSDRKHRYHFKSLESMSEELLYQESSLRYQEYDTETTESKNFIETIKNEKFANALQRLTPKQCRAVELAYWKGYKHWEIAASMGCKRNTVTELLARAVERISRYMMD
ncbi:MAG TPA: sigma-70 family RNA polymerase sigma factor [Pseudobacteroides sp.]|uniref:RNA polymerase sigma factor n=1 Tax=Pseudobacteroides sp. TaxID=1968840 RepID=UPI002F948590